MLFVTSHFHYLCKVKSNSFDKENDCVAGYKMLSLTKFLVNVEYPFKPAHKQCAGTGEGGGARAKSDHSDLSFPGISLKGC